MTERLIFHVDVNSAFLSWSAVRELERGNPDLRLIPAAVGGDKNTRTGIILAKSIPAKKMGVRTGEPVSMALRKCPTLTLVKPDFKLYLAQSRAFMDICRDFAPVVEQYSIDECFLDMSGTHLIYPDPVAAAHDLKNRIRDTLGFTVNIGIGSNKLLAKTAGDFEKPDKIHTLFAHEIPQKLWPLPVEDMIGVGASTADKLHRSCIKTAGDIARIDLERLQAIVGKKHGEQLHRYANGMDDSPVLAEPEAPKGYSISTTLEDDVTTTDAAHAVLLALTDSVTARMRADRFKAGGVGVTVRTLDFKTRSHQRTLDTPTDVTADVFELVKKLLAELWPSHAPLRLLGVSLFDVTDEDNVQLSLFADEDNSRSRRLDKAVDDIRNRFGSDGIVRAGAMNAPSRIGRKYKAKHELDSSNTEKES